MIQKATVYDLQKILERGEKGKTCTVEEIKVLMDAYIKGTEQQTVAERPPERVVLTFYIRTVIINERNKIKILLRSRKRF